MAFTVRALDAGPVIACERLEVDDQIKVYWNYYVSYGSYICLSFRIQLVFRFAKP